MNEKKEQTQKFTRKDKQAGTPGKSERISTWDDFGPVCLIHTAKKQLKWVTLSTVWPVIAFPPQSSSTIPLFEGENKLF